MLKAFKTAPRREQGQPRATPNAMARRSIPSDSDPETTSDAFHRCLLRAAIRSISRLDSHVLNVARAAKGTTDPAVKHRERSAEARAISSGFPSQPPVGNSPVRVMAAPASKGTAPSRPLSQT